MHRPLRVTKEMLLANYDRLEKYAVPNPKHPMFVSVSEMGTFKRCRVKWWWGYQCQLTSNAEGAFRNMGTLFHDIKEQWYHLPFAKRTPKRMKKIAIASVQAFPGQLDQKDRMLVQAMAIGYAVWVLDETQEYNDIAIGLRTVMPERKFDLALTKDGSIRVRGKLDNLFEPEGGLKHTLAMEETKTRSSIAFDVFDLSDQVTGYLWAMRQEFPGYRRYECYPTIARRQMPGPRVRAALFGRTIVSRSAEEVDQWGDDMRRGALDMLDAAIYPNRTKECNWDCDFQNPCLLRADRSDLLHALKTEYHTITYHKKGK
jgi:hypothetical protein